MTRITQQQLESYLWGAAVLLRGTIDAGDYKQFIFPLLFFKRLCDVYDEEKVTALRESGGDQDFALFPENHRFQVPVDAHWLEIRKVNRDVGSALQQAMRSIEVANQDKLIGIFGDAQWTNKDRLSDGMLRDLIEHFSTLELTVANLPEDELGQGYEYLIKKFADDAGHTAAEFYTNRTVVHLMTEMLDVQPGESVYDPTCGSGGMLLSCITHLRRQGKEWRNVKLYGQELNLMTSSIARMNCFLHGIEDFRIERGDTLAEPKLVEGDRLQRFDVVLANPPYSIKQWNREGFASDPWGRNIFGVPPQGRADYAFQQHIVQSLKSKTGRCAVLWPHGILFRDDEAEVRRRLIEADLVECVIGLGPNLFYNSAMDSCIVICRTQKPKDRRGKILLINAKGEVTRERAQSFLTDGHIARITLAYRKFMSEPGFSCIAKLNDIRLRNYNLNIAQYISEANIGTPQETNTLDSVNTAFHNLLGSSNQLHLTVSTLLRTKILPEIEIEDVLVSLPEWFDRTKWRTVKLGEVVRQVRDKVDSASSAGITHYLPGGGISGSTFQITEWKAVNDGVMGPAFHMRFMPGHVLYKSRVPHGVAVADRVAICANTTYVLQSNSELLDQRLLPYLLVTDKFRQFEKDNNRGSTNLFLNYSDIAKFEFDLPPIDQQSRIADILWAVDAVGEKLRRLGICARDTYESTLEDFFFAEKTSDGPCFKIKWQTTQLQNIVLPDTPIRYGIVQVLSHCQDGVPTVAIKDLNGNFRDSLHKTLPEIEARYANSRIRPGDLLLSIKASVGDVAIVPDHFEGNISRDLARIRCGPMMPANLLLHLFRSHRYRAYVSKYVVGSTRKEISIHLLRRFEVPLPPENEAKSFLDAVEKIKNVQSSVDTHVQHLMALRTQIIEKVFA